MPNVTKRGGSKAPILCATDFSENAKQAAEVAVALAARLKRPLLLAHVVELLSSRVDVEKEREMAAEEPHALLDAEAARLQRNDVTIEPVLLTEGWAEQAILDLIKARSPELVVVSAVSKTAFDRWTLGSVSERIAQSSPAPTLVVRSAASLQSWARGERSLRIFVAADFSGSSDCALAQVNKLTAVSPCEVTVAHVNWPPRDAHRIGETHTSLTENEPQVQRTLERDLRKRIRAVLDAEPAQIVVRPSWGRADALLVDLGRMANADVMLVGGNQWHGLGRVWHTSISRGILHHAPTNVLIAPKTTEQVRRITPIQRVLVATDFSPIGNEAVPHAYSLVGEGGEVCLLHVITSGTRKAEPARAFERAAAGLEALVPAKTAARGIKTDVEVEQHDTPADAICQAAERFGADVICLGSHGRSGWQAAMLGSVAQQVLARGQRPVYIVRAPAE